jgi:ADP-heptose:LPS heptosyltransferase
VKEIAILNLTRLGDLVQTSPVLLGLRARHPEARIHLIVKSRFREMAELLPAVDVLHEIDGDAIARTLTDPELSFVDAYAKVSDALEELSRLHFDVVVNFTHSRASAALIALLSADSVVGFAMDREGQRTVENPWLRHMATLVRSRRVSHLNLVDTYLGSLGLAGSGARLGVRVPQGARAFAGRRLGAAGPRVGVQLGASADNKTWSVERYAAALRELAARRPGIRFVVVGVAAERPRAERLIECCPGLDFVDLAGETRVAELAAVLERLDLLLTNDTGTMHLAGAVGAKTCALFVGPGYPWETAVYAEGHWTLHSRIECAPCGHFVRCGHPVCHEEVPPAWLAALVAGLLDGGRAPELAPLARADLHRTTFDEDGLLDLVPQHRRRAAPDDLMALAFRPAFLESFTARPARSAGAWLRARERFGVEPGAWTQELPAELPAQLAEMANAASRAATLAASLAGAAHDAAALRHAGAALERCEQRILALARAEPLLAPLGYSLEEDMLMLPQGDLPALAGSGRAGYERLARRAAVVADIIRGPAPAGSASGGPTP